jgi:uncharacterized membrane protein
MGKGRLEAFSDGVLAIIITIMVLELHPPHGASLADLRPVLPSLLSYVLSFVYVGIYWSNHHHLLHVVRTVRGPILWANMHLLFWLSLTPFTTNWISDTHFATIPVTLYGANLLMNAVAYTILVIILRRHEGADSLLARAIGRDVKGWVSLVIYAASMGAAFIQPALSMAGYVLVALIWLAPDRRIERALAASAG